MSRKRKKKRRKIIRSETPQAAASPTSSGHDRLRRKVRGLLRGDRPAEAIALVDRALGGGPETNPSVRLRFLLSAWPERVIEELIATPTLLKDEAIRKLLTALPFLLTVDELRRLEPLDGPLAQEMLVVSTANEAIAAGDDVAAAAHLSGLGLRSPLRDARLFLEALSAFYRGDDVAASAKLQKLRRVPLLRELADRFLAAAKIGAGDLDLETASRVPPPVRFGALEKALYPNRIQTIIGLKKAEALLARREVFKAWKAAAAWADTGDPAVIDVIHRDLMAASAALVKDPPDLFERAQAAFPSPLAHHESLMMTICIENEAGHRGAPFFLRCSLAMLPESRWIGQKPFDLDRMKAALLHRAAGMQKFHDRFDYYEFADMVYNELEMSEAPEMQLEEIGFSDDIPTPMELLEKAIALDDRDERYWQALIEADRELSRRPRTRKIAERYLKRFPESLKAAEIVVNTLAARKSYDKAIRTVEKTMEKHPMDGELRKTLCRLLILKAVKQQTSRKEHLAVMTFHRVLEVRGVRPEHITQVVGSLVALGRCRDVSVDEPRLLKRAVETGVGPWSLEVAVAVETDRLHRLGRGAKVGAPSLTPPAAAPTESDLRYLLSIYGDLPESRALTSKPGRAFIRAAVERGLEVMTRFDTMRMASKQTTGRLALCLLERCQEMPEADDLVMVERYELALREGRPKGYFKGAEEALRRLLEPMDPWSLDFNFDWVKRIETLIEGIRRRLRRREKSAAGKTKQKKTKAPKAAKRPTSPKGRKDDEGETTDRQIKLPF